MDFKQALHAAAEFCRNSPFLVLAGALAVCILIYIVIDAHRTKKKRPRHRAKSRHH